MRVKRQHMGQVKVKAWARLIFIVFLLLWPQAGQGSWQEKLLDPYYASGFSKLTFRLLYGGVNSSATSRHLSDVRGGGLEGEYEKMQASSLLSGVAGFGYLTLDDSSANVQRYIKTFYLKGGCNFLLFSSPSFLNLKAGPDIRLLQVSATGAQSEARSAMGLGLGLNLSFEVSVSPKWFVGGGMHEGMMNFADEELTTRFFSLHLQRDF